MNFFGMGGWEMLVIGILALVVVGPKDLPRLMQTIGKLVAQLRGIADEFRAGLTEMARQTEIDDMRKEIEALKMKNPIAEVQEEIKNSIDPVMRPMKDAKEALDMTTAEIKAETEMTASTTTPRKNDQEGSS